MLKVLQSVLCKEGFLLSLIGIPLLWSWCHTQLLQGATNLLLQTDCHCNDCHYFMMEHLHPLAADGWPLQGEIHGEKSMGEILFCHWYGLLNCTWLAINSQGCAHSSRPCKARSCPKCCFVRLMTTMKTTMNSNNKSMLSIVHCGCPLQRSNLIGRAGFTSFCVCRMIVGRWGSIGRTPFSPSSKYQNTPDKKTDHHSSL